jgi:hypothetical protein
LVSEADGREDEMAVAKVIPLRREHDPRPTKEVVAVVLADGTVRRLDEPPRTKDREWSSGQITGADWVLWWQRRAFPPTP